MCVPQVHVTGDLSKADRDTITRATKYIDERLGLFGESPVLGEPWVVIAHDLTHESMLFASRRGINIVFSGQDADELAAHIRQYAEP